MYVVCFDISLHYNVYVEDDDASTLYIIAVVTSLVWSEGDCKKRLFFLN